MEELKSGEAPENTEELLRKFCAKSGLHYYMLNPIRRGGFLYATNGHIIVRVNDNPAVEAGEDNPKVDFESVLRGCFDHAYEMKPINVALPPPEPCHTCEGTKMVVECDVCDGNGEFENGSHSYECRECDGDGFLAAYQARAGKRIDCPDCHGTGHRWNQAIKIGNTTFARRYVALLLDLPGVRIWTDPDCDVYIACFAFDGGIGAVMPCVP